MDPELLFREELAASKSDPDIADLLIHIDNELRGGRADDKSTVRFSTGTPLDLVVPLSLFAVVFYKWAMDVLNHRRNNLELDNVKQQIELIDSMAASGWPRDAAEEIVSRSLKEISKRNLASDAALQKILTLADKAQKAISNLQSTKR